MVKNGKRWYCKGTKAVQDTTFEVTLFQKGQEDTKIRIHSDVLCAALGVDEAILKKSAAPDLVTLFFKKPELINTGVLTIKNQRLIMEAIEAMILPTGDASEASRTLSLQNIDAYLGKAEGAAVRAFATKVQKTFA